jgi:hypothetical protein
MQPGQVVILCGEKYFGQLFESMGVKRCKTLQTENTMSTTIFYYGAAYIPACASLLQHKNKRLRA